MDGNIITIPVAATVHIENGAARITKTENAKVSDTYIARFLLERFHVNVEDQAGTNIPRSYA